jgi:hypothetical protein
MVSIILFYSLRPPVLKDDLQFVTKSINQTNLEYVQSYATRTTQFQNWIELVNKKIRIKFAKNVFVKIFIQNVFSSTNFIFNFGPT